MRRAVALYILVVALAILIRLYPTIVTRMPFSIDAWPLLRDAELIGRYTPISLDDPRLDRYNSLWPGSILSSVILSKTMGVNVGYLMSVVYPFINGLGAVLLIYLFGLRICGWRAGLLAALFMCMLYPAFYMGAGVTKETYTYTLYLTIIYLTIFIMGYVRAVPILITIFGMVLSHHLTTFMAFASLLTVGIVYLVRGRRCGFGALLSSAAVFTVAYIHYMVLGYVGLRLPELMPETLISMGAYLIVFLFLGYIHPGEPRRGLRLIINILLALVFSIALVYASIVSGVSMELPQLGEKYLIYAVQYIVLGILLYVASTRMGDSVGLGVYLWFLGVSWIIIYALFGGNPFFTGIIYRFIDFLIPPLVILAAYTLSSLGRSMGAILVAATIILVLTSNAAIFIDAFYNGDPYLGSYWRNSVATFIPAKYITGYGDQEQLNIYGDFRIKYMYQDYYGLKVYTSPKYFMDVHPNSGDLVIYTLDMAKNGFVQSPYKHIRVGEDNLINNLNRIYDNQGLWIYG